MDCRGSIGPERRVMRAFGYLLLGGALLFAAGCSSTDEATMDAPPTSTAGEPSEAPVNRSPDSTATTSTAFHEEIPDQTLVDQDAGVGSFEFDGHGPNPDEAIDVFYYAPERDLRMSRILVVMPGRGRNADEYRDEWLEHAAREDALLLVPEFPDDSYSVAEYNLGNVVDESGGVVPKDEWTFSVIEALYEYVSGEVHSDEPGYYLYGHSAGGQFVHRFMLYMDDNSVLRSVSANSGWYTVPDPEVDFPYGLRDGPTEDDEDVERMVGAPLTVLLGTDDNDPDSDGLRSDVGSREQGATRLDRGFFFFRSGQQSAEQLGASFAWELEMVNGIGHSNAEMAAAAATALFRQR